MSLETSDGTLVDRLARPGAPVDLIAVVGYLAVAVLVVFRPGVYGTPIATALGLPALLFAPGYALVSLLFPGATPDDAAGGRALDAVRSDGLGGGERAALGFGISLAFLPAFGLALAASPWAIAPVPVLVGASGFAVACSIGAAIRRLRRPADRRFSVPVRGLLADARRAVRDGSVGEVALDVALAGAVVVAVAAVGYAVAAPGPGQSYTDAYLLSQNETGQLVADDYPRNFTSGESRPIVVGLDNHEGAETDYTVVVELQRVQQADDGGARVVQDRRLAAFTPTVADGETWRVRHDVTPTMTGDDLRLAYLVYRGAPPENPSTESAYEHVHVWVNVSA
ncbi:DUF1616 domain-containing protein [Halorussus marinus]|uniref:DUF1616 domain-containing protein n=1 Tax=Halorussus marinus TaxID=2505976 RepID=UPI00106E9A58|nr:DUF1616 domain-containing protein [Halorussus marinus]